MLCGLAPLSSRADFSVAKPLLQGAPAEPEQYTLCHQQHPLRPEDLALSLLYIHDPLSACLGLISIERLPVLTKAGVVV